MKKTMRAVPAIIIIMTAFFGCAKDVQPFVSSSGAVSPFASFRDIPGVTDEEIKAIEALQKEYKAFSLGASLTTEAFINENGEIGGYTALLCEWLSDLFGIPFELGIYTSGETLEKVTAQEIDFVSNLRITEKRTETFYMTESISDRWYVSVRLAGSRSTAQILQERPLKYAFMEGFTVQDTIDLILTTVNFEVLWVHSYAEAYAMLESGNADAFIGVNVSEASFDYLGEVYIENVYPLMFSSQAMATANPKLEPIITVLEKALRNGGSSYMNHLHSAGNREYRRHKFNMSLSDEERAYISSHPDVPVAANLDNYPIMFFNAHEKEWQGIFFDLLKEITALTGVSFNVVNGNDADWPVVYDMVLNGEAAFTGNLHKMQEREGLFLWPDTSLIPDYYALVSKTETSDIALDEVLYMKVGLPKDTSYATKFREWFPSHTGTVEYETMELAMNAMQRGEIDMVMASQLRLMLLTHHQELPDFKSNVVFDHPIESTFGFNKDEAILCSIVDKALKAIDIKGICERWMRRTSDYRAKIAEARLPWLIGAIVLASVILALILVMFYRSRNERKRLGKLVKEKTSTLTAILDATNDIIFCKDLDSRYILYNKSMETHFNLGNADIVGKNDMEALGVPVEMAEQFIAMDKKVIKEMKPVISEELTPSADGKQLMFETIKTPIIQDGKVTGLVGMSRDITRRKAMEEEARSASEAKSRFIANMSHEMRTPMNVVVGLTDLMLEEDDPVNIRENLKKINSAGNTLMGLINDVLDISKIEAGKLELMPTQHDIASNLNDVITLNLIRIEDKPVTFKLDIHENLPCTLYGDELRIRQIMNNLLNNAFKYTRKGTVTLGIDSQREGDNVWMSIYVSDTGIGIKQEDMVKLFTDYNQVDTHANRTIEGTGLGLSITKKLVELMDGEISVESEYGKGTTFRVRIRVGFVNDATIGKETVENLCNFRYSDKRKRSKLVRSDLSYARVLLVDDFPTNLDVAAGMLRKYKMHVDCMDNGQSAVDLVAEGEPVYDAVFMDHMMPGMDGVEATALIRAIGTKYAQNVPIIALTANAVAGNEQMFLDSGFSAYLSKPINVMVLDSIVQRWVRDKSRE
ncbi:MAG: ATP-binding protein [Treponema sp.]|nr:ATP-binding protein [Treponema sp.]